MKRILIIEDEFFLLESMVKFMGSLENVRTKGCANLRDALDAIQNQPPDLIFSDINLPDGSGLELINHLSSEDIHIPLIFVSAYIADYRNHIPKDSNVLVLEKPVSMKRLREIAREKLAKLDHPGASDYVFKLSDYLQIAAMGGHTVRLMCGDGGSIDMVKGQLWAASDRKGLGEAAFGRLVAELEVHGKRYPLSCKKLDDEEIGQRNIQGSLDNLLLNAVWQEEEDLHKGHKEEASISVNTEDFETLMDKGIEKLLAKAYLEALELFTRAQALEPENRTVATNISRLHEMGYHLEREAS